MAQGSGVGLSRIPSLEVVEPEVDASSVDIVDGDSVTDGFVNGFRTGNEVIGNGSGQVKFQGKDQVGETTSLNCENMGGGQRVVEMKELNTDTSKGHAHSHKVETVDSASRGGHSKTDKELSEMWPGDMQFCAKASCMASGTQNLAPASILFVQLLGFALLFAFPVRFLTQQHDTPVYAIFAALLSILCLWMFLATALSDPGILPRCAPNKKAEASSFSSRPPRKQNLVAHGRVVGRNYCDACNVYQPPFTVHCSMCSNCVRRFDHHCPWVGNCIGARNYRFFFGFLWSATFVEVYSIVLSALHLVDLSKTGEGNQVLRDGAGSIALLVICTLLFLFVLALLLFHTQLIINNKTTYEQMKQSSKMIRPVGTGVRVIKQLLFGNVGVSYVKSWARVVRDRDDITTDVQVDAREVYGLGNIPKDGSVKKISLSEFRPRRYFNKKHV
mmetsp:Transcript_6943/g.10989  ORF Transcript_6943/g.10989 Transcript_6943/m.10989 type:complete len:444 (+) Transcript_6943:257-1588(+)